MLSYGLVSTMTYPSARPSVGHPLNNLLFIDKAVFLLIDMGLYEKQDAEEAGTAVAATENAVAAIDPGVAQRIVSVRQD